jgi:hypothetical protein
MANQSNYPEEITTFVNQRPSRISAVDEKFIKGWQKNVLFGTSTRDVIELWIYNPDGTFANFVTLEYFDPTIGLSTILDSGNVDGQPTNFIYEYINLNLKDIVNRIGIDPGRYSFVANFFVNEVGADESLPDSYQLYLKDVSDDRTEVKVSAILPEPRVVADIVDFVTPSVPRLEAQALTDQTFGFALDGTEAPGDAIELDLFKAQIDGLYQAYASSFPNKFYDPTPADDLVPSLQDRLDNSDTNAEFALMLDRVLPLARQYSLDALAADFQNFRVQRAELLEYVRLGINKACKQLQDAGLVDNRFIFV